MGARSEISPMVATTAPSSTRSPMRALLYEASLVRCVDEALPSDAANGPRFSRQGERRAGLDDLAEPLAPHGLNGDIDVLAGDEIWPEADGEFSDTALVLGDRPLPHAGVNQGGPIRRSDDLGERLHRDWHHIVSLQGMA
jgi:hypothetical protein